VTRSLPRESIARLFTDVAAIAAGTPPKIP
jgi:hypothetical protein